MSKHYLHFTLGPVQGFVSQARRTRDFWAGSFLLSWLTAHAMKAVQKAGGSIVMPSVKDDDMLKMVLGEKVKEPPKIGSLPNNFIARVDADFNGNVAVNAVQQAWRDLADAVWDKDKLAEAGVNKQLWDSQIGSFWDMAWVVADSDDAAVLAQRKNWRSYMPPKSLGDKCTMMGEWQELSGADRPNPKQQAKFWHTINSNKGLDLRENERLCAIAYVKRRFVHAWDKLPNHQGWKLDVNVPSVSYMAAVHWLGDVMMKADEADIQAFHDAARSLKVDYGEWSTDINCISKAIGQSNLNKRFASLDGRMFFESELEKEEFKSLQKSMKQLKESAGVPSPFYAILMMDGDSLGETKAAMGDASALSAALGEFTQQVPKVVKAHNGFLIYAGGDDVLAILPLEDALACAAAVRAEYMAIFARKGVESGKYSISAAIEYAHMKLPLAMILKDAHQLLDDVAKDATGRDAVACRVWKPGGLQQTWAMPWDEALDDKDVKIAGLAERLGEDKTGDPGYASKFLYHLRDTLNLLEGGSLFEPDEIEDLLVADYVSSGLLDGLKGKEGKARELIKPLLNQCRVFKNKEDTKTYSADGALLLRFLAQKGVER
ncbi:MAG: type III-B CRISPR-associated protein Cas10/Cmr2 [Zetaproteobacteria bacterium CG_4_9_14_3_um_filter_49_83]|nr:MAG: type III-B CRISPR-associated protein Cas10/Cmr2 [Zetaproteobacteria bacterium CG17_big_fil_post_rev_8_21_14_2_50_50_13]PIV29123.1 MAG: type III-B CRISPR-associated protein Cas10/Cmr2 [Zetaproteobacteria bacterium CG02_land_8_20_14_3_00_50_9]PJA35509.1 MAG: type III-B CRISPR-associated protein Cas10/Cmr2 [Zetaproteobacteria bacterium CG_4_9_14_3_um_filter_49_83]